MDETLIINQIKAGNKIAFKQLFDMHYAAICLYLVNFTKNRPAAEDMAQMVFIDLWNKRESIIIHTALKSYLYKMAYNHFLMSLRKKNKEATLLEQLKYEALQTIEAPTELELENKAKRLQAIIAQLPERCQEILKLKMAGLKYKEIAERLDLSIKTVESQMRIAFIKIRENYKDDIMLFLLLMD
ncbi:RNA polymerase sigma-70 factor [Bizionia argentinensis JUB59]|uniref:RNA polymerase sigma-70 factor n=1 Tax=Bizionia argentinensis JUB59 TaxID=1046627 RepID=G2EHM7_9FLAO|nr:RNA polymerase sigma-70 factor [Bizionia argentinensis]EGV42057.2 RNA polymerase sigma-70 factor [Bizionia argentinensis JUB59]